MYGGVAERNPLWRVTCVRQIGRVYICNPDPARAKSNRLAIGKRPRLELQPILLVKTSRLGAKGGEMRWSPPPRAVTVAGSLYSRGHLRSSSMACLAVRHAKDRCTTAAFCLTPRPRISSARPGEDGKSNPRVPTRVWHQPASWQRYHYAFARRSVGSFAATKNSDYPQTLTCALQVP